MGYSLQATAGQGVLEAAQPVVSVDCKGKRRRAGGAPVGPRSTGGAVTPLGHLWWCRKPNPAAHHRLRVRPVRGPRPRGATLRRMRDLHAPGSASAGTAHHATNQSRWLSCSARSPRSLADAPSRLTPDEPARKMTPRPAQGPPRRSLACGNGVAHRRGKRHWTRRCPRRSSTASTTSTPTG